MSQIPGIHAYEKPVENDFEYVYTENKSKGFRKVTKAMMKVLLGVATKLSELENDTGFIDKTVADLKNYYLKTETYSKKELDDKIALIPKFSVKVVYSLPFEDIDENTIYLVPANDGDENLYTEYINVNGLWEILGTQKVPNVEVTKESIESALGYTPADNAEFRQLSDTVNDQQKDIDSLKQNGTGSGESVNKPLGDLQRTPIYPCTVIYLDGDTSEMTKENDVLLDMLMLDEYGNVQFEGKSTTSWQGSGSLAYPNKNLSLKLKDNEGNKVKLSVFPDYKTSSYHLKCNWLDYSMVRNVVGARMALDFDDTVFPVNDVPITVKSIPVIVYLNGEFNGCYTLNYKQDDKLYGMDTEGNPLTEIIYRSDYLGWDLSHFEYRGEAEETAEMQAKLKTVLDFVSTSTDATFVSGFENHFDLNNAINYWLYADFSCATDNMLNNFTLATWNGVKWYMCWYDLDIIFGLLENASNSRHPNKPTTDMLNVEDTKANPTWAKLYRNFFSEIRERYWELRKSGVMSPSVVTNKFRTYQTKWSTENIEKDRAKWTARPNTTADVNRIHGWVTERLSYLDNVYGYDVKYNLNNAISSNTNKVASGYNSFTTTISPKSGYKLETVTITMGGVDITSSVYDTETATITIPNVTDSIVITVTTTQLEVTTDDINVTDGVMTINSLASTPIKNGAVLTIE